MNDYIPLWSPKNKRCKHNLPPAHEWELCVFRCSKCNLIFQSRVDEYGIEMFGWAWKQRSERWLKRRVRKKNGK